MSHDAQANRNQQAQALILQHMRQQREGSPVSDQQLLDANPRLREELAAGLKKAHALSLAFAAAQEDNPHSRRSAASHQSVMCPACHTPLGTDDTTVVAGDTIESVCGSCGRHVLIRQEPLVDRVAHYELIDRLGVGGFGTVWRALDTKLDREVALKIARHNPTTPDEDVFVREAKAAAVLKHPQIVATFEVGRDGETSYIASELIEGISLKERLEQQPFTAVEAAGLCSKIACAVHYAHQEGVIHRDLKPQNILLDLDGQPHVADFGLARRPAHEITVTMDGQVVGTPAYMSPEQAIGDSHSSDQRSDVYALGVILFELLTGELPFRGSLPALMQQVVSAQPPRPRSLQPRIPRDLETICLKCLEKRPEKRYQTAQLLAQDLDRYLTKRPIHARPVGYLGRATRWCQRKPAVATLLGLLMIATATGFAGITLKWRETQRALVLASEAEQRARTNLQAADGVVDEFLITVAEDTLLNQPYTEHLRRRLLEMGTSYYGVLADVNATETDVMVRAAMARAKLGNLSADMGNKESAIEQLDQAIAMLRRLESQSEDPRDVHRHLYQALLMKGEALASLSLTPEAFQEPLACFLDAQRYFDLASVGKIETTDLRAHARMETALANGYQIAAQNQAAIECNARAIGLWQQIIDRQPNDTRALASLAARHSMLASLYKAELRFDQAPPHHEKAIQLMRQIVAFDPSPQNRQRLASALMGSQTYQDSPQDEQEAIPVLEEAVAIQSDVVREYPMIRGYQRRLLSDLCLLGNTKINVQAFEDAHANFDRMLEIIAGLRQQDPGNDELDIHVINALFHKALAFKKAGDTSQALTTFERVATIADSLSKANPDLVEVAVIHSSAERNIAEIFSMQDALQQAADHLQRAITIAESVRDVPQRSKMLDQIIILARDQLARLLLKIDPVRSAQEAEIALKQTAKLRNQTAGQFSWLDSSEVALQYGLGKALMAQQRHPEALEHFTIAVDFAEASRTVKPGFENALIHCTKSIAEIHLRLGNPVEAIASADELLELIEPPQRGIYAALVVLDHALKVVAEEELLDEQARFAFVTTQTSRAIKLLREGLDAGLEIGEALPYLRQSSSTFAELIETQPTDAPQTLNP